MLPCGEICQSGVPGYICLFPFALLWMWVTHGVAAASFTLIANDFWGATNPLIPQFGWRPGDCRTKPHHPVGI